jgi:N-acetylgalactosamine-N,N'-diacetylbacillosaminyl-diphospho-undecaprenol 4-alpha-N-acetylgalactosaminyltransferase
MNGIKPKLLIFINTLQSGGAERVVWLLLNHLKADFELHLALYSNYVDYKIPNEVKVFHLNQPLKQNRVLRLLKLPFISHKVYKYCVYNHINTSVAFLYRPCYINALLKSWWGFKGKVIMCERTHQTTMITSQSYLYRLFSKFMVKYSYQRANLILANSYAIQTDLIEKFHIKTPIRVIYNPIDLHFIKKHEDDALPLEFEKDVFHFVNVGGFRKEKNHLLLLQAFFILKHLPCKLIIVGGGVMEEDLKQKVNDLGIASKVIFCGFDTNPFKYVKQSDCFVLSSDVEGFPNVLIEALACGKPVISTDCHSGPRELLAPNTDLHHRAIVNYEVGEYGILTPVNDIASLATAMKKMYEDAAMRKQFESKAKQRALQFDVNEIKQYFQVAFTAI